MDDMVKRKRSLVIIFILIISHTFLYGIDRKEVGELIKRTISVMPVINESGLKNYDYLQDVIREIIYEELLYTNLYNLLDFKRVDSQSNELYFDEKDFLNQEKLHTLSIHLKSDAYLITRFQVFDNIITINAEIYDVIIGNIIIQEEVSGAIGIEIYDYINELVQKTTTRMEEELHDIEKDAFDKVLQYEAIVLEEKDQNIIAKLLTQTDKYRELVIKRNGKKYKFAVPVNKSTLALVSDRYDEFAVDINGKIYKSENGFKLLAFENDTNNKWNIDIKSQKDNKRVTFSYQQKSENDIVVKRFFYHSPYLAIETGSHFTTALYICQNVKFEYGIPHENKYENRIFFNFLHGANINIFQRPDTYQVTYPHLKFRFGLGYTRVIDIKDKIRIHAGVELGFGFFLHRSMAITKSDFFVDMEKYYFAYPNFHLSFPITVEFFRFKRISLIAGIEPIVRVLLNLFFIDRKGNQWYFDLPYSIGPNNNHSVTRGIWYDSPFRVRPQVDTGEPHIPESITYELFFYDMPITFAMRIRI